MQKLYKIIEEMQIRRGWGEITLRINDGRPTMLKVTEQIKLENNDDNAAMSRKNHRCSLFHLERQSGDERCEKMFGMR